jgi:uncharacterized YccA/Bax inhibitor family protein
MLTTLPMAILQSPDLDSAAAGCMGLGCMFIAIVGLFALAITAFMIFCWWRILTKAGYHGALSLLMLTGIGGLILVLILAFGDWPALKNRQ